MTKWLSWLPPVGWAGLIFFMSSKPGGPEPSWWFLHADKLIHAAIYSILAFLLYIALRQAPAWRPQRAAVAAFLIAVLYGVSDELHQSFIPDRSPDPIDVAADAFGAMGVFAVSRRSTR